MPETPIIFSGVSRVGSRVPVGRFWAQTYRLASLPNSDEADPTQGPLYFPSGFQRVEAIIGMCATARLPTADRTKMGCRATRNVRDGKTDTDGDFPGDVALRSLGDLAVATPGDFFLTILGENWMGDGEG